MSENFWLGPTYEFEAEEWSLTAGVPAEEGRLEWLLRRVEDGEETLSHSFVLEPHATAADLQLLLSELPEEVATALVGQAAAQTDPRLLSEQEGSQGLA